jgi:hypothetical protein
LEKPTAAPGVSVAAMFNAISISSLFVLDQDEAAVQPTEAQLRDAFTS